MMEKPQSIGRFLFNIGLLAGFVVVLYLVFELFIPGIRPSSPVAATSTEPSPPLGSATDVPVDVVSSPSPPPYPPPGTGITPATPIPFVPQIFQNFYEKSSLFDGVKVAALVQGSLWLVQSERQPDGLVDLNDVAVIYGWNHDGTKLLFGRGLYDTSGDMDKSTQLWVYDLNIGKLYPLMDSTKVWSASWSPVDDRVAYIEYGEPPNVKVVSIEGKILQKRDEYVFSDLAWSPDGSAIAVSYNGPELVDFDTRYSALAIWWLEKDEFQILSDATREVQFYPIWLTDGNHILFVRLFYPGSEGGTDGLFIADIQTKNITPVQNVPKHNINRIMRSPRSDTLVLWMNHEVYIMESGKEPVIIGNGGLPVWHPDGKTVIYLGEDGLYTVKSLDIPVGDQIIGGNFSASTIPFQPRIFFQDDAH